MNTEQTTTSAITEVPKPVPFWETSAGDSIGFGIMVFLILAGFAIAGWASSQSN